MINITDVKTERLFEPLNATAVRRLEWEDHFRRANYNSQDAVKGGRDNLPSEPRTVVQDNSWKVYQKTAFMQVKAVPRYDVGGSKEISVTSSVSMSRPQSVKLAYNYIKIAEIYQRNGTTYSLNRQGYSQCLGGWQRIWLRLLKMGKHSYRLGIVARGVSLSVLSMLRQLVWDITRCKGEVTSGYVNGVNCSREEE